jgi:gamma-butyrobetaine dioxygenase
MPNAHPHLPQARPLDLIADVFASAGSAEYLGEPVSVRAHLLQCGHLAHTALGSQFPLSEQQFPRTQTPAARASAALVAAALLHDVGHLLSEEGDELGDVRHGAAGAAWLSAWFPSAVTEPVRLHVAAKRYLCGTDPEYFGLLSQASVRTLELQGGPMTADEALEFAARPHAAGAVAVRRWDDQAKDPAAEPPGFEHFRPLLESLLLPA